MRQTLSNAGVVQGVVNYDPWGAVQQGSVATFGFTGEVQDGGNVYLRARWYNASAGRFTSVDPFEGFPQQPYSLHQYQYGYSAPFTQVLATITTRYTQDLASPLSQVLNSGGANYVYGAKRLYTSTSGGKTWYAADALGSVRQTLSNTGVVQGAINYDPWGAVQSGSVATFGFTGEVQDGSNVYLRARWYNASAGRFVGVDPWEGNAHARFHCTSTPMLRMTQLTPSIQQDGKPSAFGQQRLFDLSHWISLEQSGMATTVTFMILQAQFLALVFGLR